MKTILIPQGITYQKIGIDEEYYRQNNVGDSSVHITGAGIDQSVISWSDAGYDPVDDGTRKLGTFRSYTMYVTGREAIIENLTIENTAGDGRIRGQAIALYADADKVTCRNVHLKGHQDTLFLSPLPDEEREKDGFRGPRQNSPRRMTTQYYENCIIEGDIDFIFGGADATFVNCTIVSLYRPAIPVKNSDGYMTGEAPDVQGYICAPCTPPDHSGFKFIDCHFITDRCPDNSVYLARPWRPHAAATFEDCTFGAHISDIQFAGWNDVDKIEPEARFVIKTSLS